MVIYEKTNEITHSVSVQLLDKDYRAGDQLYIRGQIYAGENDKYVDHYELYMVPGNVSSVTSNTHKTTGLVGAMNISDSKFWSSFTKSAAKGASAEEDETDNKAAELNADGKFNLVIPEADMKTAGLTPSVNGGYTIFVKTHYTTASGLEPTFHALTYVDNRNATGVDMIEVEDSNAPAIYFNMNGQQVNGKNMAPGIYIKKQGNKTTKVVVK
ncbi:MAG: hypothetical protein J1E63_04045 [Muribaculaceae bacterium]|nr:hypothetical protein [Muribaculaceae bacterium]